MLTTSAFNAFLKTLEEPPEHVLFILATTDPQKIPNTILSRCQRFDLQRITVSDISKRLRFICSEEEIKLDEGNEDEILDYISKQVDGGMRDAIKLLQKCTSLDEIITVQTVVEALGSVDEKYLREMFDFISKKDVTEVIKLFNRLVWEGIDIKIFISSLVDYVKDTMMKEIVDGKCDVSTALSLSEKLLDILSSLRNSTQVKTLVEIGLIKLCAESIPTTSNISSSEEKNTAPTKKEVKQEIESIPADQLALKQVTDKLTLFEKRIVATEMQLDTLKFSR